MNTNKYFVVFSLFAFLVLTAAAGSVMADESYPDFLGDDSGEADYLDESSQVTINDPLEPMNRAFFQVNDKLYFWVLKPVTKGYMWVFPLELRESFGNFFKNIAAPVRLLNALLQGDLSKSGVVVERFLINSTVGVYGLADIADKEFNIGPKKGDFGQTLGKWGLGEGIYILWPVVGPSNVRDTVGLVGDTYSHPVSYFFDNRVLDVSYYTTNMVNTLSLNPNAYEDLKRFSVDPYTAARQAYYEYRKAIIENE